MDAGRPIAVPTDATDAMAVGRTGNVVVRIFGWAKGFVAERPGGAVIVSHDRAFLDETVTRILYLDPETRATRSYTGNWSAFAATRAHEHDS